MLNKPPDKNSTEKTGTRSQQVTLHIPSATPTFIVMMLVATFILWLARFQPSAAGDMLLSRMGLQGDAVLGLSQYYRLITAQFLLEGAYAPNRVVGGLHALISLYTLYIAGIQTEKLWGSARAMIVFTLGGAAGAAVTLLIIPFGLLDSSVAITTASNSIMALLAADMVYLYKHRRLYRLHGKRRQMYLSGLAVVNLIVVAFAPHVDLFGVVGGMAGGAVLAAFISPYMLLSPHPDDPGGLLAEDVNPLARRWVVVSAFLTALIGLVIVAVLISG